MTNHIWHLLEQTVVDHILMEQYRREENLFRNKVCLICNYGRWSLSSKSFKVLISIGCTGRDTFNREFSESELEAIVTQIKLYSPKELKNNKAIFDEFMIKIRKIKKFKAKLVRYACCGISNLSFITTHFADIEKSMIQLPKMNSNFKYNDQSQAITKRKIGVSIQSLKLNSRSDSSKIVNDIYYFSRMILRKGLTIPNIDNFAKLTFNSLENIWYLNPLNIGHEFMKKMFENAQKLATFQINTKDNFTGQIERLINEESMLCFIKVSRPAHSYHVILPIFNVFSKQFNYRFLKDNIIFCRNDNDFPRKLAEIGKKIFAKGKREEKPEKALIILHPEGLYQSDFAKLLQFIKAIVSDQLQSIKRYIYIITSLEISKFNTSTKNVRSIILSDDDIRPVSELSYDYYTDQLTNVKISAYYSKKPGYGKTTEIRKQLAENKDNTFYLSPHSFFPRFSKYNHIVLSPELFDADFKIFDELWEYFYFSCHVFDDGDFDVIEDGENKPRYMFEIPALSQNQLKTTELFRIFDFPLPVSKEYFFIQNKQYNQHIDQNSKIFNFVSKIFTEEIGTCTKLFSVACDLFGLEFKNGCFNDICSPRDLHRLQSLVEKFTTFLNDSSEEILFILILRTAFHVVFPKQILTKSCIMLIPQGILIKESKRPQKGKWILAVISPNAGILEWKTNLLKIDFRIPNDSSVINILANKFDSKKIHIINVTNPFPSQNEYFNALFTLFPNIGKANKYSQRLIAKQLLIDLSKMGNKMDHDKFTEMCNNFRINCNETIEKMNLTIFEQTFYNFYIVSHNIDNSFSLDNYKLNDFKNDLMNIVFQNDEEQKKGNVNSITSIVFAPTTFKRFLILILHVYLGFPIIMEGFTGCGKTSIIKLLFDMITGIGSEEERKYDIKEIRCDGDTTKEVVMDKINRTKNNIECDNAIIFFDELNTSPDSCFVLNLMAESSENSPFRFVAAINPYMKVDKLSRSLARIGIKQVIPKPISKIHMSSQTGEIKELFDNNSDINELAYNVKEIPEFADFMIINADPELFFDDENIFLPNEEKLTIEAIIFEYLNFWISKNKISIEIYVLIDIISQLIFIVYSSIRTLLQLRSILSYRDVKRVLIVFQEFYNKLLKKNELMNKDMTQKMIADSIYLSFYLSFATRFSQSSIIQFSEEVSPESLKQRIVESTMNFGQIDEKLKEDKIIIDIRNALMEKMLELINRMPFMIRFRSFQNPEEWHQFIIQYSWWKCTKYVTNNNVFKLTSIMTHLFAISTCCSAMKHFPNESLIPCIIIGMPGTSKSLAVELYCQYQAKKDGFFSTTYLCSRSSEAEGLDSNFYDCALFEYQTKSRNQNSKVYQLCYVDEIGLANLNETRPLKKLHYYFDRGVFINDNEIIRVFPVAVSNYSLDFANMNRGILLCTDLPSDDDIASAFSLVRFLTNKNNLEYRFEEEGDVQILTSNKLHESNLLKPKERISFYSPQFQKEYQNLFKVVEIDKKSFLDFLQVLWDFTPTKMKPEKLALRPLYNLYQNCYNDYGDLDFSSIASSLMSAISSNPKNIIEDTKVFLENLANTMSSNVQKDFKRLIQKNQCISNIDLFYSLLTTKRAVRKSICIRTKNYEAYDFVDLILNCFKRINKDNSLDISVDQSFFPTDFKQPITKSSDDSLNILLNSIIKSNEAQGGSKLHCSLVLGNASFIDSFLDVLNSYRVQSDTENERWKPLLSRKGFSVRLTSSLRNTFFIFVINQNELLNQEVINPFPLPLLDRLDHVYFDFEDLNNDLQKIFSMESKSNTSISTTSTFRSNYNAKIVKISKKEIFKINREFMLNHTLANMTNSSRFASFSTVEGKISDKFIDVQNDILALENNQIHSLSDVQIMKNYLNHQFLTFHEFVHFYFPFTFLRMINPVIILTDNDPKEFFEANNDDPRFKNDDIEFYEINDVLVNDIFINKPSKSLNILVFNSAHGFDDNYSKVQNHIYENPLQTFLFVYYSRSRSFDAVKLKDVHYFKAYSSFNKNNKNLFNGYLSPFLYPNHKYLVLIVDKTNLKIRSEYKHIAITSDFTFDSLKKKLTKDMYYVYFTIDPALPNIESLFENLLEIMENKVFNILKQIVILVLRQNNSEKFLDFVRIKTYWSLFELTYSPNINIDNIGLYDDYGVSDFENLAQFFEYFKNPDHSHDKPIIICKESIFPKSFDLRYISPSKIITRNQIKAKPGEIRIYSEQKQTNTDKYIIDQKLLEKFVHENPSLIFIKLDNLSFESKFSPPENWDIFIIGRIEQKELPIATLSDVRGKKNRKNENDPHQRFSYFISWFSSQENSIKNATILTRCSIMQNIDIPPDLNQRTYQKDYSEITSSEELIDDIENEIFKDESLGNYLIIIKSNEFNLEVDRQLKYIKRKLSKRSVIFLVVYYLSDNIKPIGIQQTGEWPIYWIDDISDSIINEISISTIIRSCLHTNHPINWKDESHTSIIEKLLTKSLEDNVANNQRKNQQQNSTKFKVIFDKFKLIFVNAIKDKINNISPDYQKFRRMISDPLLSDNIHVRQEFYNVTVQTFPALVKCVSKICTNNVLRYQSYLEDKDKKSKKKTEEELEKEKDRIENDIKRLYDLLSSGISNSYFNISIPIYILSANDPSYYIDLFYPILIKLFQNPPIIGYLKPLILEYDMMVEKYETMVNINVATNFTQLLFQYLNNVDFFDSSFSNSNAYERKIIDVTFYRGIQFYSLSVINFYKDYLFKIMANNTVDNFVDELYCQNYNKELNNQKNSDFFINRVHPVMQTLFQGEDNLAIYIRRSTKQYFGESFIKSEEIKSIIHQDPLPEESIFFYCWNILFMVYNGFSNEDLFISKERNEIHSLAATPFAYMLAQASCLFSQKEMYIMINKFKTQLGLDHNSFLFATNGDAECHHPYLFESFIDKQYIKFSNQNDPINPDSFFNNLEFVRELDCETLAISKESKIIDCLKNYVNLTNGENPLALPNISHLHGSSKEEMLEKMLNFKSIKDLIKQNPPQRYDFPSSEKAMDKYDISIIQKIVDNVLKKSNNLFDNFRDWLLESSAPLFIRQLYAVLYSIFDLKENDEETLKKVSHEFSVLSCLINPWNEDWVPLLVFWSKFVEKVTQKDQANVLSASINELSTIVYEVLKQEIFFDCFKECITYRTYQNGNGDFIYKLAIQQGYKPFERIIYIFAMFHFELDRPVNTYDSSKNKCINKNKDYLISEGNSDLIVPMLLNFLKSLPVVHYTQNLLMLYSLFDDLTVKFNDQLNIMLLMLYTLKCKDIPNIYYGIGKGTFFKEIQEIFERTNESQEFWNDDGKISNALLEGERFIHVEEGFKALEEIKNILNSDQEGVLYKLCEIHPKLSYILKHNKIDIRKPQFGSVVKNAYEALFFLREVITNDNEIEAKFVGCPDELQLFVDFIQQKKIHEGIRISNSNIKALQISDFFYFSKNLKPENVINLNDFRRKVIYALHHFEKFADICKFKNLLIEIDILFPNCQNAHEQLNSYVDLLCTINNSTILFDVSNEDLLNQFYLTPMIPVKVVTHTYLHSDMNMLNSLLPALMKFMYEEYKTNGNYPVERGYDNSFLVKNMYAELIVSDYNKSGTAIFNSGVEKFFFYTLGILPDEDFLGFSRNYVVQTLFEGFDYTNNISFQSFLYHVYTNQSEDVREERHEIFDVFNLLLALFANIEFYLQMFDAKEDEVEKFPKLIKSLYISKNTNAPISFHITSLNDAKIILNEMIEAASFFLPNLSQHIDT